MKVFLIVVGCIVALLGGACSAGGATLLAMIGDDGYLETGSTRVTVESSAIVSDRDQVESVQSLNGTEGSEDFSIRIRAESRDPGHDIFIGIAPAGAFEDYTSGARVDLVYDLRASPPRLYTMPIPGNRDLAPPTEQSFWLASVSGPGEQELEWTPGPGEIHIFVMNADGSPGLDANVSVGVKLSFLRAGAIAVLVIGLLFVAGGIVLIVVGARRKKSPPSPPMYYGPPPGPPGGDRTPAMQWPPPPPPPVPPPSP